MEHLQILLKGIVADPDQRISQLPLLTEAERRQLLVDWNDTQTEYPRDRCVHELFEEQVERTPDRLALQYEGRTLTYQQLNSRANQFTPLAGIGSRPRRMRGHFRGAQAWTWS